MAELAVGIFGAESCLSSVYCLKVVDKNDPKKNYCKKMTDE